MRRFMLAVAVLAALATSALAQTTVTGDGKKVDANNSARVGGVDKANVDSQGRPTQRTWSMAPDGSGLIQDSDRDRSFVLLQPNILTTILCDKCGCTNTTDVDSSAMVQTRGYNRLRLRIRVGFPVVALCNGTFTPSKTTTDSLFAITFGIHVRTNTSSVWDSTSTAVLADWRHAISNTASAWDSAGSLTEVNNKAWDDNPEPGEFVFVYPLSGGTMPSTRNYQNYTREIDLVRRDGQATVGDYTGVRIRELQCLFDTTPTPTAMSPGKPVFVTIDLLGAR